MLQQINRFVLKTIFHTYYSSMLFTGILRWWLAIVITNTVEKLFLVTVLVWNSWLFFARKILRKTYFDFIATSWSALCPCLSVTINTHLHLMLFCNSFLSPSLPPSPLLTCTLSPSHSLSLSLSLLASEHGTLFTKLKYNQPNCIRVIRLACVIASGWWERGSGERGGC